MIHTITELREIYVIERSTTLYFNKILQSTLHRSTSHLAFNGIYYSSVIGKKRRKRDNTVHKFFLSVFISMLTVVCPLMELQPYK